MTLLGIIEIIVNRDFSQDQKVHIQIHSQILYCILVAAPLASTDYLLIQRQRGEENSLKPSKDLKLDSLKPSQDLC